MPNFYIKLYSGHKYQHGGIGYVDAETILDRAGYLPLTLPRNEAKSVPGKLRRLITVHRLARTIPVSATVVFLYPVYAKMYWLLVRLLRRKGCRLICYIMDIDGLKDGHKKKLQQDIRSLRGFREFVVHNAAMADWLREHVNDPDISNVDFFDFLTTPVAPPRLSSTVIFAGNLHKSGFIKLLPQMDGINLNLYGDFAIDARLPNYISRKGSFDPHDLPERLQGSFGLVWDGDSPDVPTGSLGDYMKYITHHKISLYMLAGAPLIAPKGTAAELLIKKYDIGLVVNRIADIPETIKALPEERFYEMQSNMKPLAIRISEGQCLLDAISELNG